MAKTYLYFATEENAFEGECLGTFDTNAEAQSAVREYLEEDFEGEEEGAEGEIDASGWEGEDVRGYRTIYAIGTKEECEERIAELRAEMLEEFEG